MENETGATEGADIPTENNLNSDEAHSTSQDAKTEAFVDTVEIKKPTEFVYGILIRAGEFVQDYRWNNIRLNVGAPCVVENENGRFFGTAARARQPAVGSSCCKNKSRIVLRKATPEDISNAESLDVKEKKAMSFCRDRILDRDLPMNLSKVQYAIDGKKATFFFTADGRVDFRELVKDLVNHTRIKIEMRQIGVRDESRMLGGCGPCGAELCCSTFLNDFAPISIRMAKDQNLSLNPAKISGVCGRLMCCLGYEHKNYKDLQKKSPKLGKSVVTPDGIVGRVCQINLLQEKATVSFENEEKKEFSTRELTPLHLADKSQIKEQVKPEPRAERPPRKPEARGKSGPRDETAGRKTSQSRRPERDRQAPRPRQNEKQVEQNREKTQGETTQPNSAPSGADANKPPSSRSSRRRRRRRGKGGGGQGPKPEGS